mmetsp:Transcript_77135/g.165289  ORF Transcript_77135/g.165289 Transcript_77135/m.165289 type:complete len:728 (-) Transcript_77135:151-2334(-)
MGLLEKPLEFDGLFPPFKDIQAEHVVPGIQGILDRSLAAFEQFEQDILARLEKQDGSLTYEFVAREYEALQDRLERSWQAVSHLKSVCDSDARRKAVEEIQPKVVEFGLRVGQSSALYKAWNHVHDSEKETLSGSQKRIVEIELRDARLSGVALEGPEKERFGEIQKQLEKLSTNFSNNLLDGTKAYTLKLTEAAQMKGLPHSALELAAQTAKQKGDADATPEKGPWVLTLDYPSYLPVMQYADDRSLREKMYKASVTKASEFSETGKQGKDNAPIIREILQLRQEKAKILGYKNHGEVSLSKKMATLETALALLEDLREKSFQHGKKELEELREFAKSSCGFEEEMMNWDVNYYSEKLKEAKYAFNEEELKPYFALPRVQEGLWALAKRLFAVDVRQIVVGTAESSEQDAAACKALNVSLWRDDVLMFAVEKEGKTAAYFFFDPYSHPETKKGGAWMSDVCGRSTNAKLVPAGEQVRVPVAHIVCNGSPPIGDKPSLMNFRDVETLFHEFGHALQHMLTQEPEGLAAGINNVDWDAVEQPSQFMENWVYDKPTVDKMAFHYETGEPIPEELFGKLIKAKTYRAASMMLRQLHFAILDLKLHTEYDPNSDKTVYDLDREVGELTDVMKMQPYDRFLNGFSHIFAGGYAAGYFSYMWAEVLSADCFGAFEEVGLDNEDKVREVGRRFRDTVLAMGGGTPPAEVFEKFRGRGPQVDALLRHNGLAASRL